LRHIDPIIYTFNILSAACAPLFCERDLPHFGRKLSEEIENTLKEHEIAEKLMLQLETSLRREANILYSEDKLLSFLKRQINIENQIVESLNSALGEIGNPVVKGVLKGISLDSVKHAEMYASAVKLLTSVSQALTQENLDKQRELVEEHIRIEAQLIERISKAIPSIKNKKVKLLLNAILLDEKRHHELLRKVLEILVRGETITEEDWWDVLWKNVPFHGAPGG
jgi:rubrerythrin